MAKIAVKKKAYVSLYIYIMDACEYCKLLIKREELKST